MVPWLAKASIPVMVRSSLAVNSPECTVWSLTKAMVCATSSPLLITLVVGAKPRASKTSTLPASRLVKLIKESKPVIDFALRRHWVVKCLTPRAKAVSVSIVPKLWKFPSPAMASIAICPEASLANSASTTNCLAFNFR